MGFGDAVRKAMDSELIEPPKGQYKTRLIEAGAFEYEDKRTGDRRQAAKVTHEITAGELQGSRFEHFMGFHPQGIAEMNGNACAAYGVNWTEVETHEDLDEQLRAVVAQNTTSEVSVFYKNGYMNVNVHGSRTEGVSEVTPNGAAEKAGFAAQAAAQFGEGPAATGASDGSDHPFD